MTEEELEKAEKEISEAERIQRFLADPAVKGAIVRMSEKYIAEWKAAKTVEEREQAHAKSTVADDLALELSAVVGRGVMSAHRKEQHEANRPRPRGR